MSKKALNIDSYCDSEIHLREIDPTKMLADEEKRGKIDSLLQIGSLTEDIRDIDKMVAVF